MFDHYMVKSMGESFVLPDKTAFLPQYWLARGQCVFNWLAKVFFHSFVVQGAEAQLKEVWEETDGLNQKDFDPRTFFYLHGRCIENEF